MRPKSGLSLASLLRRTPTTLKLLIFLLIVLTIPTIHKLQPITHFSPSSANPSATLPVNHYETTKSTVKPLRDYNSNACYILTNPRPPYLALPHTDNITLSYQTRTPWQMNSRILCKFRYFCLPATHPYRLQTIYIPSISRNSRPPACYSLSSKFHLAEATDDGKGCDYETVRKYGVGCWWGRGRGGERCAEVMNLGDEWFGKGGKWSGKIRWYGTWEDDDGRNREKQEEEEWRVLVPEYAWTHNIYHFARMWVNIWRIVGNMQKIMEKGDGGIKRVRVLFRMVGIWGWEWHSGFRRVVLETMKKEFGLDKVVVDWLFEDDELQFLCVKHAVVLGAEGSTEAFLFLNDSSIRSSPPVIPVEALKFKEEVRKVLGLESRIRLIGGDDRNKGVVAWLKVPGRTLGYLVRDANDKEDVDKHRRRNLREFSEEDEIWFRRKLNTKADRYGLNVSVINWNEENMSFVDQVRIANSLGGAVGIHGANLLNTMFMASGGGLFEVMPYRFAKRYYYAGSNSGLRYSSHSLTVGEDFDCSNRSVFGCELAYRNRDIKLDVMDRHAVEKHLEDLCEYLDKINRQFESTGWMPLRKLDDGTYEIDGFTFRVSPIAADNTH